MLLFDQSPHAPPEREEAVQHLHLMLAGMVLRRFSNSDGLQGCVLSVRRLVIVIATTTAASSHCSAQLWSGVGVVEQGCAVNETN
jgi:hypothetical protein